MMVFSLLGGLFPMTAYADDPECNLTLTITPDSVTLPASVTLSGTATDYYSGAPIINGRVVFRGYGDFGVTYTDENGDYSYIWTLPSDMPSDTYHIQADLDYYSDDAYADLTVSAPTWTITASARALMAQSALRARFPWMKAQTRLHLYARYRLLHGRSADRRRFRRSDCQLYIP
jgi:hypothetical protein